MAIEILRSIHERPPRSQHWRPLTHIDTSTEERTTTNLDRLRRSMPLSEFKVVETRYDPTGVEDDDIPF